MNKLETGMLSLFKPGSLVQIKVNYALQLGFVRLDGDDPVSSHMVYVAYDSIAVFLGVLSDVGFGSAAVIFFENMMLASFYTHDLDFMTNMLTLVSDVDQCVG